MSIEQTAQVIKILLVDDNEDDILIAIEAFREANFNAEIMTAQDGIEALEILRNTDKKQPDMILLDLNMPRKDGHETLSEIKNDPLLKCIPVIVLTTSNSEKDINKAYDLHANSYIIKPINFDEFVNIANHLKSFWFQTAKLPNVS